MFALKGVGGMRNTRLEINPKTNKLQARDKITGQFKGVSGLQKGQEQTSNVDSKPVR